MAFRKRARPFPKILVTLALLAITAAVVYFVAVKPSTETVMATFKGFGEFICKYDKLLIGILIVVNLVELIDILIFAKRDECINAHYEVNVSKSFSLGQFFRQYFAGSHSRAPLIYATEEQPSALPRIIICAATGAIKFVFWLALFVGAAAMLAKPEIHEFSIGEGADYSFTMFVLFFFLNVHVLVYALYRILPLHESRTYETVTYYSDGSSVRGTETRTNIIAMLVLTAMIYMFYSAYYIFPLTRKTSRVVETIRFYKLLDSSRDYCCIRDFYG